MTNDKIIKHWVRYDRDKFTNTETYFTDWLLLPPKVKPDSRSLQLQFNYLKSKEEDVILIKLKINYIGYVGGEDFLSDGRALFLLNDDETIEASNIFAYDLRDMAYLDLEIDKAFIAKLASAQKILFSVRDVGGIKAEGQVKEMAETPLNEINLFAIRGFYNGIFDPEFRRDELLSQISLEENKKKQEREERERKEREERERKERETEEWERKEWERKKREKMKQEREEREENRKFLGGCLLYVILFFLIVIFLW